MKKFIFFFAAAAALAACSKNEVTPAFSNENTEIAYNVAPKTKADPSDFSHDNVFASWAYYLPNTKNWDTDKATAEDYIVNSTISYQTDGSDSWKETDKTYYWPKGGKLTFYAYSLNKDNLTLNGGDSHFTCSAENGITGAIDLDAAGNENTDFLVADIAKDKSGNEGVYSHKGVPTLFKHRLSRVACTVKTDAAYEGKKFLLNSITFTNLSHFATYGQYVDAAGDGNLIEVLTPSGTKTSQTYTSSTEGVEVTTTATAIADENRYIYIPQEFTDETAEIVVKYTIETTVGTKTVKDECTAKFPVKSKFDKWEMGKKYTINLTFTLAEILWDPAVSDWTDGNSGNITIE